MNALFVLCATVGGFAIPDTPFARQIVSDRPELAISTATDLQRVNILREWAWSRIDYAPSKEAGDAFRASFPGWASLPADQLFATYESDKGGVLCGGAALSLRALYAHFGYRAWDIANRANDGDGHAVTVVEIDHKGAKILCVQDPSFNYVMLDFSTGEPLDYLEMLSRLKKRQHQTIVLAESNWRQAKQWPKVVVPREFTSGSNAMKLAGGIGQVSNDDFSAMTKSDGTIVIESPRCWSLWVQKNCYRNGAPIGMLQRIMAAGYPECPVYWLTLPSSCNGPDATEFMLRAKSAAGVQ